MNKNLGNAFVVVWRIGDEDSLLGQTAPVGRAPVLESNLSSRRPHRRSSTRASFSDGSVTHHPTSSVESVDDQQMSIARKKRLGQALDLRRVPGTDLLADRALIAYLKVIAEINRNRQVLIYRSDPRLTQYDSQQYKVRMGFGLHVGWAIEGAVGSLHKVDATYLSPHVNMAARLESSSRQYGVPLLLSHVRPPLSLPHHEISIKILICVLILLLPLLLHHRICTTCCQRTSEPSVASSMWSP